jgi:hypothetical protein
MGEKPNKQINATVSDISKAIVLANEKMKKQELDEKKKEFKDWQKKVGYIDYSKQSVKHKKIKQFGNDIKCFFKLLFLKKEDAVTENATYALIRLIIVFLFDVIRFVLYAVAFIALVYAFFSVEDKSLVFDFKYMILPYPFVAWLFARMFRLAAFEMENLESRKELLSISSIFIAVLALLISIIGIFIK